jgi:hypothetical protein
MPRYDLQRMDMAWAMGERADEFILFSRRSFIMYVWSKQLVIGLLLALILLEGMFFLMTGGAGESRLLVRTTQWITANYVLLMIWIFVWMYDQARVRGKNVWVWVLPYVIFPLPTLAFFILRLQRRIA